MRRLVVKPFWIILVVTGVMLLIFQSKYRHAYRQYETAVARNIQLQELIKQYQMQVEHKKYFIYKWQTDKHFRDQLAHEQGGYINEGEWIIYFVRGDQQ